MSLFVSNNMFLKKLYVFQSNKHGIEIYVGSPQFRSVTVGFCLKSRQIHQFYVAFRLCFNNPVICIDVGVSYTAEKIKCDLGSLFGGWDLFKGY